MSFIVRIDSFFDKDPMEIISCNTEIYLQGSRRPFSAANCKAFQPSGSLQLGSALYLLSKASNNSIFLKSMDKIRGGGI